MSWDQEYNIESFLALLIKLTGKHPEEVLQDYLNKMGIGVINREPIVVDENGFFGPVKGEKITLSDGRVFVSKLVEKFNENGNHGIDFYEFRLENDTPEVVYVGLDSSDPDIDSYTVPENYGECCDDGGCGCGD